MTYFRRNSVFQDPIGNARSGLPMPSTIKKPTRTRRMSMSGPAMRGPMLPPAVSGPVQRNSMMRYPNAYSLLMSASKPGSSPSRSQLMKKPRNPRDRAVQAKTRQDVVLGNIFQHLLLLLDPKCPFKPDARLEEQFIPPLKPFKYSFARFDYMISEDPTLQDPTAVPDEFENIHHHQALAMGYYLAGYEVFMSRQDVYPERDKMLEDCYGMHTEGLNRRSPIEELTKLNKNHNHDKAKFEEVIHVLEDRKQRLTEIIAHGEAEIEMANGSIDRIKAEHARLTEIVKVQNLSPEEVHRMNAEHETKHKIAGTNRTKVTDAEEAVDAYTNLLSTLDYSLRFLKLAFGVDSGIWGVIKPSLAIIAELKHTEQANVESERIHVDYELDQLITECENVEDREDEIRRSARLKRDLTQTREVAMVNGVGVKSRLQLVQIVYMFDKYREQNEVDQLRNGTIRAFMNNRSGAQLKYLRNFVEANEILPEVF
ncbi:hypothetical protein K474DRAFT_1686267 [Panus rudis PR-1116 ss-1]|nr:hypothetical protein K474DRAFT_1686267 [Panus rudis PR-1116 ss-1]